MTDSVYFSLGLTVVIETIILVLLMRPRRWREIALYGLLINCFTQPLATYSYRNLVHNLAVVEIAVCLIEAVLLMQLFRISAKRAAVYSFIANGTTTLIGVLIYYL